MNAGSAEVYFGRWTHTEMKPFFFAGAWHELQDLQGRRPAATRLAPGPAGGPGTWGTESRIENLSNANLIWSPGGALRQALKLKALGWSLAWGIESSRAKLCCHCSPRARAEKQLV